MSAQKLLLDPRQQADDEFAAARRRALAARDRFASATDLADAAWPATAPPTGQPTDPFLTTIQKALAADDFDIAAQLLRAELKSLFAEDKATGKLTGTAQRPKRYRKHMSRMAWLMVFMRLG